MQDEYDTELTNRKKYIKPLITAGILVLVSVALIVAYIYLMPKLRYDRATEHLKNGEFRAAKEGFASCLDYKDAEYRYHSISSVPQMIVYTDADGIKSTYEDHYDDRGVFLFSTNGGVEVSIDSEYYTNLKRQHSTVTFSGGELDKAEYSFSLKGQVTFEKKTAADGNFDTAEYIYDEKGRKIYQKVFHNFDELNAEEYRYEYDSHGMAVHVLHQQGEKSDETVYRRSYDKHGYPLECTAEITESGVKGTLQTEYVNTKSGITVKVTEIRKTDDRTEKSVREYDSTGKNELYSSSDTRSVTVCERNKSGFPTRISVTGDGNTREERFEYDNRDRLVRRFGGEAEYEYEYDENGNLLSEREYTGGTLNKTTDYSYDEDGNITCKAITDADNKTETYNYGDFVYCYTGRIDW